MATSKASPASPAAQPASVPVIGHLADHTPVRLRLHPDLARLPGWETEEEFEQLCRSVAADGVITPLLVHVTGEIDDNTGAEWADIVDGKHRFAAVMRALVEQNPEATAVAIPCTETERAVQDIMIRTLLERRHATKGTRAYLICPLVAPVIKSPGRPRKDKLPTELVISDEDLDQLAARYGISDELLRQARRLHEIFAARKDLREELEPGILSGDIGLGGALAGIAGKDSTFGKDRADPPHLRLLKRGFKDLRVRFGDTVWTAMPEEDRATAKNEAVECVLTWPEEVRKQLKKAL